MTGFAQTISAISRSMRDAPPRAPCHRQWGTGSAAISIRYALVMALLCTCCAIDACAEPPLQLTAFGLAVGQSPDTVRSLLTQRYPSCAVLPSVFHKSDGYPPDVTAILDMARGTLDTCQGTPEGKDLADALTVKFVHPSVAESQPAYEIDAERAFPDPALVDKSKIRYSFESVRANLFRTYGRPTEVRRDRTTSSAADLEKSLAMDKGIKREDYRVRYLWADRGHVDEDLEHPSCDCGPRYVEAFLEISRSPSTRPRNQFFVLSVHLLVHDSVLGAQQETWNAQWRR
jgi:hypothetical protein